MAKNLRTLKAILDPASIRTETFDGREHLVVPIVALLGDKVIFATGAAGPELVPAEELAKWPLGWNNRPATADHPPEGSANFPLTLERQAVGSVFNTTFEDNKLKMEGWVDVAKCERLGGQALDLLTRLRNAEVVEVSVGASVTLEQTSGTANGESYIGKWRDIIPDHLAFLPPGVVGACSVEMGAGVRTATRASMLTTIRHLISDEGRSFSDTHAALRKQLNSVNWSDVSGDIPINSELWGIDQIYPESQTLIAVIYSNNTMRYFRFQYDADTLEISTSTVEEVVPAEVTFKSLRAEPETHPKKVEVMNEKVKKILAMRRFANMDQGVLESLGEEHLDTLLAMEDLPASETPSEPEVVVAPEVSSSENDGEEMVTIPRADWDQISAMVAEYKATQAAQRAEFVAQLRGKVNLTTEQLSQLDNSALKVLCADIKALEARKAASAANFSFAASSDVTSSPKFKPAPRIFGVSGNANKGVA